MTGRRLLFGFIAIVAALIACVGVFLPGLPTTPFVLVALWASSRSSRRISAWIRRVPVLRSAVVVADDYLRNRTLPLGLKIFSQVVAMTAVPLVYLITRSVWITVVVGCAVLSSTVFMVLTPTTPRSTGSIVGSPRIDRVGEKNRG